jgi:hypothetical protein
MKHAARCILVLAAFLGTAALSAFGNTTWTTVPQEGFSFPSPTGGFLAAFALGPEINASPLKGLVYFANPNGDNQYELYFWDRRCTAGPVLLMNLDASYVVTCSGLSITYDPHDGVNYDPLIAVSLQYTSSQNGSSYVVTNIIFIHNVMIATGPNPSGPVVSLLDSYKWGFSPIEFFNNFAQNMVSICYGNAVGQPTIVVGKNFRYKVTLPDGSREWAYKWQIIRYDVGGNPGKTQILPRLSEDIPPYAGEGELYYDYKLTGQVDNEVGTVQLKVLPDETQYVLGFISNRVIGNPVTNSLNWLYAVKVPTSAGGTIASTDYLEPLISNVGGPTMMLENLPSSTMVHFAGFYQANPNSYGVRYVRCAASQLGLPQSQRYVYDNSLITGGAGPCTLLGVTLRNTSTPCFLFYENNDDEGFVLRGCDWQNFSGTRAPQFIADFLHANTMPQQYFGPYSLLQVRPSSPSTVYCLVGERHSNNQNPPVQTQYVSFRQVSF